MTASTTGKTWGPRWFRGLRTKRVVVDGTERLVEVPVLVRADGTAAERRHAPAEGETTDDGGGLPPLTPAQRAALEREKARTRQRVLARLTAASLVPEPSADVPTGAQIAARRTERGFSQRDLAAAAGVSRGLVAEIERGRRTHWVSRWRLAAQLGMAGAPAAGGA